MEVKKILETLSRKKVEDKKNSISFEIKATPALLTEVGRKVWVEQYTSGEIKPPEGWDDIKTLLYLALDPKLGEPMRRIAIAHLAFLARTHRIGETLLTDTYNALGNEIQKNSEDFPQFKTLVEFYQGNSGAHNHKRSALPEVINSHLLKDLQELLPCE